MIATSDGQQVRQVPIDEAVSLLHLSRRTIERRLARGTLAGTKDGGRWLVDVPLADMTATEVRQGVDSGEVDRLRLQLAEATAKLADMAEQVADLTRQHDSLTQQLADMTATGDVLRQRVDELTSERDYLRSALAAALTLQQKALPERTETGRRWWWPFGKA